MHGATVKKKHPHFLTKNTK